MKLKYKVGDEVSYRGHLARVIVVDESFGTVYHYKVVLLEGWLTAQWVEEKELNVFWDLWDVCAFIRKEIKEIKYEKA